MSFFDFPIEIFNKNINKYEATGEANGKLLWRPLGSHWEATVRKRASDGMCGARTQYEVLPSVAELLLCL